MRRHGGKCSGVVHSRVVILTRMPGKSFGNNVITIVCPKEAFRLSGVCYYVVVDHGAFEIADATPSALWLNLRVCNKVCSQIDRRRCGIDSLILS